MRRATDSRRHESGVTLIELIVAIVVMGVLVTLSGMFVRGQVDAYLDIGQRADLADQADTAMRRIMRDLQSAVPNSVRVTGSFLEFVPIRDAGRYRAQKGVPADNELDFTSAADNSFEVFGPGVTVVAGDQLVISNLGIAGADYYAGDTRRPLTSTGSNLSVLAFNIAGGQFPFSSAQNRFQIAMPPVSYAYEAATRTLWRYSGYAIQSAQPASIAGLDALPGVTKAALATDVDVPNSFFSYGAAALTRNAIVSVRLTLSRNGESVTLFQQINVFNSP